MRQTIRLASAILTALVLTNCGGLNTTSGSDPRAARLSGLGYQAMRLQKTPGDARYSGRFAVNGQEVRFLIDSGANSTDLDAGLAQQAGIKPDHSIKVVSRGALGRPVTSKVGLGALSAGSVTAQPFPFMLAPTADRHTATSRYDGQMGLDALGGLAALIDLERGKLWLPGPRSRNAREGQISPLGRQGGLGFEALTLYRASGLPHLLVESKIDGQRLTWVVDTGAEVTVLSSASAQRLRVPTAASRSKIIDASGDRASVRIAVLENVVFGRLVVSEFQVAVTNLATIRRTFRDRLGVPVDGIIGMDFLEESSALLDAGSRVLYVGDPAAGQSASLPPRRNNVAAANRTPAGMVGLRWSTADSPR